MIGQPVLGFWAAVELPVTILPRPKQVVTNHDHAED